MSGPRGIIDISSTDALVGDAGLSDWDCYHCSCLCGCPCECDCSCWPDIWNVFSNSAPSTAAQGQMSSAPTAYNEGVGSAYLVWAGYQLPEDDHMIEVL